MLDFLQQIHDAGREATFLLPSLPVAINGKIKELSESRIVIEADYPRTGEERSVQFVTHPHTVVVVT